jgi:hypothetical protein
MASQPAIPIGLIFVEVDGFRRALIDTRPALDAFFQTDGIRFFVFHLIDLAGANLNAISTPRTFVFINHRVHIQDFKFQIADFRLKTLCAMLFALCR